jgi:gluconate 2-dehydrogenase alpha chain
VDRLKKVDVVIVGGGWTGLLMANEIAGRTPLSVLVLERGNPVRSYATAMDELDYSIRYRMMQNIADETITHRHTIKNEAVPVRQYGSFHPGTGVGGSGEHWGGASNRYRVDQFKLATHLKDRFGKERLPDSLAVQDWGLTYEDLEPYYWRAEQMMGVGGKAGNLRGRIIAGGDPFEGPRANEFPTPPHKVSYLSSLFRKASVDLGYRPFPIPTATLSQPYRNPDGIQRPGCMYCGYCARYGCMIDAKAQPSNTLLPLLANKKNSRLQTGAWVRRIVHRDGSAEGVRYVDDSGQEKFQPADVVILSSWTGNNNRLLMLSGIGAQYDPTTGKGTLGKNLTHQLTQQVQLLFKDPLNAFMGSGGLGYAIGEFAGDPLDTEPSAGILRGSEIRVTSSGAGPIASFGGIPPGEVTADWGSKWKKASVTWFDRLGQLTCEAAHLSYRQNYLDLDPTYTDKFGDPLLRFTLDWTDHERRQKEFLAEKMISLGRAMGARVGSTIHSAAAQPHYSVTYYQGTHVQGGVIMGTSAENSVLNTWSQHWHMPNVWVTGGANFPQNESANPTLTMLALAYRSADALIERYFKQPGRLL